jgi:uncharacterized membrane protein HdeD (DUF308 family)
LTLDTHFRLVVERPAMDPRTHRRLSGVVGVFLLALTGGLLALFGFGFRHETATTLQVTFLMLAGVLDVVAAVDSPVTERIAWYRLNGLASVLLGLALPLGYVDAIRSGEDLFLLVVLAVGGITIVAMGVDMLAFAGRHAYSEAMTNDDGSPANE